MNASGILTRSMKGFSRFAHLVVLAAFMFLFAGESFHAHANAADNHTCSVCQTLLLTPLLSPAAAATAAAPLWIENHVRDRVRFAGATVLAGVRRNRGPPAP
jgi:hypothetical protein